MALMLIHTCIYFFCGVLKRFHRSAGAHGHHDNCREHLVHRLVLRALVPWEGKKALCSIGVRYSVSLLFFERSGRGGLSRCFSVRH